MSAVKLNEGVGGVTYLGAVLTRAGWIELTAEPVALYRYAGDVEPVAFRLETQEEIMHGDPRGTRWWTDRSSTITIRAEEIVAVRRYSG